MDKTPIIECVPNFSEGREPKIIEAIASSIRKVFGVQLLHIDSGYGANRTVMTFIGEVKPVCEAAFQAIKTAGEFIDLTKQEGAHPRIGATDVCPLVPLKNISLAQTAEYARQLSYRVATELNIPVYCYEAAAYKKERKNLAHCRAGEYEGLKKKLQDPEWYPDFGLNHFNARSGLTIIGARKFLGAYNVNLNTNSKEQAHQIAQELRESGYKDKDGLKHRGILSQVKAIGWYIPEYGKAQVSMNLCDLDITPPHIAFECVKKIAAKYHITVSGSELIGMLPFQYLVEAGNYYSDKMLNKVDSIELAIEKLGLNELSPFIPEERLIWY